MGCVKTVIVMGVSGCGKTTVGRRISERLGWEFFDGDDFHSAESIEKMRRGVPLTDEDRVVWLERLAALVSDRLAENKGTVLACSALKEKYRAVLRGDHPEVHFVYLKGSFELILRRMQARQGHYMKPKMLETQFAALEEPEDALALDIRLSPEELAAQVEAYVASEGKVS